MLDIDGLHLTPSALEIGWGIVLDNPGEPGEEDVPAGQHERAGGMRHVSVGEDQPGALRLRRQFLAYGGIGGVAV